MVADEATAATLWFADDASPSGPDAAECGYRLRASSHTHGASIEDKDTAIRVARSREDDDAWTTFDDEDARASPFRPTAGEGGTLPRTKPAAALAVNGNEAAVYSCGGE